jgi:hypothetical protein
MFPSEPPGFLAFAQGIGKWQPEFMSVDHTYTRAQAMAAADGFDVIMALPIAYADHVAAMRRVNPNLQILAYVNGGYSVNDDGSHHPQNWYARDRNGGKITSVRFGNYLMDPTQPGWIDDVAARCRSALGRSGYDGCFLDSLGPAALQPSYVTGLPVSRFTGMVWQREPYLEATSRLARQVKRRIAPRHVVANGVGSGEAYLDDPGTGALADAVDGAMVELFVREPGASLTDYRSVTEWRKDVDMLVDAGRTGRVLLCITKAWAPGPQVQKDRLHRFAFGTFLLGTNGRSFFSFLSGRNVSRQSPPWEVPLGSPLEPFAMEGGLFRRRFTSGWVIVNPEDRRLELDLDRPMRTASGNLVRRVRMAPHSAAFFLDP